MVVEYLSLVSEVAGIPIWLLIVIVIWTITWKLISMWKAARKNHLIWFIVLAVINTAGILEILYVFIFSKLKFSVKELPLKEKKSKKPLRNK